MYLPTHFEETGTDEIRHLIEEFPLSVLIVNTNEGLVTSIGGVQVEPEQGGGGF